jgi:hypothetical protein
MQVNKHALTGLLAFVFLLFTHGLTAQAPTRVQYGGKSFKSFEVVEGSVGTDGTYLSVYLAEHALASGNAESVAAGDNLEGVPDGLYLQLEVSIPEGIKFPILPEHEVLIETSQMQANTEEAEKLEQQYMQYDREQVEEERKIRQANAGDIRKKTMEITKKMQAGEISPEEAVAQIQALTQPMLDELDAAAGANTSMEEPEDQPTYSIKLMDTKNLTSSTIVFGRLTITRFDGEYFEASLNGAHVEECMERLAASSPANEARCRGFESSYVKDMRVMSEGTISVRIRVPIKSFIDGR